MSDAFEDRGEFTPDTLNNEFAGETPVSAPVPAEPKAFEALGLAGELVQAVAVFKLSHGADAVAATYAGTPAANAGSGERRSPARAENVGRPAFKAKPVRAPAVAAEPALAGSPSAKTGTDNWDSF